MAIAGGGRLLSPSTYTQSKYRQPYRSGGDTPKNIGTLERTPGEAWHRPPFRSGGRRVTTGATGGKSNKRKTDGEEARGGEIDARAGKVARDMELGLRNLRGGERGGTKAIN